jgi:23S rRNA pseudouridine1911/1915/1917 synthase
LTTRSFTIIVSPHHTRERLDIFLTHHIENATRSKVQQAIEQGMVTVNGKQIKPSYKISPSDVVHVTIPKPPPIDIIAENIPLDILYEDQTLIVVNKAAGMVTHPAYGNFTGTLVNALLHHCNDQLSTINDPTRPGIVHRLDKDTSGLMVVAKDDASHAFLAKQFSERTIEREYRAVIWGLFDKGKKKGIIEAALGRSKSDRKKITVTTSGKHAVTEYEVIEEFDYLSLVGLHLKTGRTHQIRVHLHHIGHPVFGDPTYGGRRIAWGEMEKKKKDQVQQLLNIIGRQALHAKTLGFVHPATREFMKFDSDVPPDMQELLSFLRS